MNKSELTVHELVDCYLEEVVQPRLDGPRGRVQGDAVDMRPTTACVYRNSLRRHILLRWEAYVADLEKPEIWASVQNWLDCLVRSETNHGGLTPLSVRRAYAAMRRVFRFAVHRGYLACVPLAERCANIVRIGPASRNKLICLKKRPPHRLESVSENPHPRPKLIVDLRSLKFKRGETHGRYVR